MIRIFPHYSFRRVDIIYIPLQASSEGIVADIKKVMIYQSMLYMAAYR